MLPASAAVDTLLTDVVPAVALLPAAAAALVDEPPPHVSPQPMAAPAMPVTLLLALDAIAAAPPQPTCEIAC